jgi:Flp pilus assembly protein TadG
MAPIVDTARGNAHGRRKDERGAALVEFALTLPLLLVVIAGVVDFGLVFQRQEVITNAAREGARLAALPGYDDAAVESRVRTYVQQGLSMSNAALTAAMPTTGGVTVQPQNITVPLAGGSTATVATRVVTVNYTHSYLLLGPMLSLINATWGPTITLRATSQMRLEVTGTGS